MKIKKYNWISMRAILRVENTKLVMKIMDMPTRISLRIIFYDASRREYVLIKKALENYQEP